VQLRQRLISFFVNSVSSTSSDMAGISHNLFSTPWLSSRSIYLEHCNVNLADPSCNIDFSRTTTSSFCITASTYHCDSGLDPVVAQESRQMCCLSLSHLRSNVAKRSGEDVNLNYIYNCNDVEEIQMIRIRIVPFYALVKTFRERGLLQDRINTSVWKSKSPCCWRYAQEAIIKWLL
jgi:hypothetical protein